MDMIGYVTLAEAQQYVARHYLPADPQRTSWEAAGCEGQQVYLSRAFQALEMLPFTGRRFAPDQTTAFPRWPNEVVPECVKHAQIEDALARGNTSEVEEKLHYDRLRASGVRSYTIGNLSETLDGTVSSAQSYGLSSEFAMKLLQPYLGGGYRM